jgi:hypothetical protein
MEYSSCLLRPKNFDKIVSGFGSWIKTPGKSIPQGFENSVPNRGARPTLVVLAPEAYFLGRQYRSIRGRDWPLLDAIGETMMKSLRLVFAATDFRTTTLRRPVISRK